MEKTRDAQIVLDNGNAELVRNVTSHKIELESGIAVLSIYGDGGVEFHAQLGLVRSWQIRPHVS